MSDPSLYEPNALRAWTTSLFQTAGASRADADRTADVLIRTNLRGVDTHGVARILTYVEKLRAGEVNGSPNSSATLRHGVLHYDGDGGLGQAVGMQVIERAVEMARENAIVVAVVRRSGHLAALGMFVLSAAEAGMVAFMCQETPPLMALGGSTGPSIGNNPIAFAMPVRGQAPLVFDMATSVVARGNILQAIRDKATSIPDGWAIGPDGQPTIDPALALEGAMLPIAGHKGVGLAMMVQCLAGSLSASATAASAAVHRASSSAGNVSAFVMLINPDLFVGRDAFDTHVKTWLDTYLHMSGANARYPGQRAAECEAQRQVTGIPISASIIIDLVMVGDLVGCPFDVPAFRLEPIG